MSEAWCEVARLGEHGEKYPHILVDSHGWCLRLGPRDRNDEKYYSSIQSLVLGMAEHCLRRRLGSVEGFQTFEQLQSLVLTYLKEAAAYGAELEKKLSAAARLRPLPGQDSGPGDPKPSVPLSAPRIDASAAEVGSKAA